MTTDASITVPVGSPVITITRLRDIFGTLQTAENFSSAAYTVYQLDATGVKTAVSGYSNVAVDLAESFYSAPQTASNGFSFNFIHCIEGAFTSPLTRYLVVYEFTLTSGHIYKLVNLVTTGE